MEDITSIFFKVIYYKKTRINNILIFKTEHKCKLLKYFFMIRKGIENVTGITIKSNKCNILKINNIIRKCLTV